jgi:hypothetical protein
MNRYVDAVQHETWLCARGEGRTKNEFLFTASFTATKQQATREATPL